MVKYVLAYLVTTILICDLTYSQTSSGFYLGNNTLVEGQKVPFIFFTKNREEPANFYLFDDRGKVITSNQWRVKDTFVKGHFVVPEELGGSFYIAMQQCDELTIIPIKNHQVVERKDETEYNDGIINLSISEYEKSRDSVNIRFTNASKPQLTITSVRPLEYGHISNQLSFQYTLQNCYRGQGFQLLDSTNSQIVNARLGITQTDDLDQLIDVQFDFTDSVGQVFPRVSNVTKRNLHFTLMSDEIALKEIVIINEGVQALSEIIRKLDISQLKENSHSELINEQRTRQEILKTYPTPNDCENEREPNNKFELPVDYQKSVGEYYALNSFEEVIRELLPYVKYKKRGEVILESNVYNQHRNRNSITLYNYQTLSLIDNKVVYDINDLITLLPSKIDYVNIYLNKTIIDNNFYNGILSVRTREYPNEISLKNNRSIVLERTKWSSCYNLNQAVSFQNPLYFEGKVPSGKTQELTFAQTDEEGDFLIESFIFNENGEVQVIKSQYTYFGSK